MLCNLPLISTCVIAVPMKHMQKHSTHKDWTLSNLMYFAIKLISKTRQASIFAGKTAGAKLWYLDADAAVQRWSRLPRSSGAQAAAASQPAWLHTYLHVMPCHACCTAQSIMCHAYSCIHAMLFECQAYEASGMTSARLKLYNSHHQRSC